MQISRPLAARVRPLAAALLLAGAALALALTLPSAGEAGKPKGKPNKPKTEDVSVMARNIYLGSDLTGALEAQSFDELTDANAEILAEVVRTDFPSRVKLLAKEIKKEKPDLIGLQEVAHWRLDTTEPDGDSGPPDVPTGTPAEENLYDFLALLRDELKGKGAKYRVAHVQEELDIELPIEDRPGDPHEDPSDPNGQFDGRLTMQDVILARKGNGVQFSKAKGAHYDNLFEFQAAGALTIDVERGWQSIQANVRGVKFRFVNTHLEAFEAETRRLQAQELVDGPAKSRKDVVLVGDFNTGDRQRHDIAAAEDRRPWAVIEDGGFLERQTKAFSCCYSSALDSTAGEFDHTVDHITVNNRKIGLGRSTITGDERRTAGDLWPSDHGGVFSVLEFPKDGKGGGGGRGNRN
jgi:endonuclease/exonuclease/phosphatase family metal-dependent hydrolase